ARQVERASIAHGMDALADQLAQGDDAAVAADQMLVGVDRDRSQADDRLVVSRMALALGGGRFNLTGEIEHSDSDLAAAALAERVDDGVEVTEPDHPRVRIVAGYDPSRRPGAQHEALRLTGLERGRKLRGVGEDDVGGPDPEAALHVARRRDHHPERRLGEAERGKLLEAGSELDTAQPSVKKRDVHRVGSVLMVLEPVAGVVELERHQFVAGWMHPAVVHGQLGYVFRRTEIREYQAVVLSDRIGAVTENGTNAAARR